MAAALFINFAQCGIFGSWELLLILAVLPRNCPTSRQDWERAGTNLERPRVTRPRKFGTQGWMTTKRPTAKIR
jgi:hypothetical protein